MSDGRTKPMPVTQPVTPMQRYKHEQRTEKLGAIVGLIVLAISLALSVWVGTLAESEYYGHVYPSVHDEIRAMPKGER